MNLAPGDDVLVAVEAHLCAALGADTGRASVAFVGVERLDVLRFGPDADGLRRYATLGLARRPMTDPLAAVADESGPRAELLLALRSPRDSVLRSLAVLAAMPAVEGLVIRPGASFELGTPLWDGARFTAVLVGEPDGSVPDLDLDGAEPVRFLPVIPISAEEHAFKRVHGPEALAARWAEQGVDRADPDRRGARL